MKTGAERKVTVAEKIEQLMVRVREMKQGGDLESLILEGIGEINRLIQEEALQERSKALCGGVFFPSEMCAVRGQGDARCGTEEPDGQDGFGRCGV